MEAIGSRSSRTTKRSSSSRPKRKPFADLTNTPSSLRPNPKPAPESAPQPARASTYRRRRDGEGSTDPPVTSKSKEVFATPAKDAEYNNELENPSVSRVQVKTRSNGEKVELENPSVSREQVTRRKGKEKVVEEGKEKDELENSSFLVEQTYTRRKGKEKAVEEGKEKDELENSSFLVEQSYTRRKGKEKAVEAVSTLSCPPPGRIRSIEKNVRLKENVARLHEAFSVPCVKTKRRKLRTLASPILSQDFVEKQKAYFAEVDAFELPVEEVSDSELE